MSKMHKRLTKTLNVGLRPFGGEVVKAGLVEAKAQCINELEAGLGGQAALVRHLQEEIKALIGRAESQAVHQAMALTADQLPEPRPTIAHVAGLTDAAGDINSRGLFFYDGQPLPCWRPEDTELYDDWLESSRNYPAYYRLFEKLGTKCQRLRMLEIGVRTGYIGAVFARALSIPAFYVGVDPNEYVANGLELAGQCLRLLRDRLANFNYALLEGYSWQQSIQDSLQYCGPFDIIHIDGDHRLEGKLIDLDLARRLIVPGGIVLVDDYDYKSAVPDAIRRAWALDWYQSFEYIPTMRGLAVLGC
jgi:predicted O-methyltransferase YrrM